jgi:hypothetical protein
MSKNLPLGFRRLQAAPSHYKITTTNILVVIRRELRPPKRP